MLMAVNMKSTIFCDIMQYSSVEVPEEREACHVLLAGYLLGLLFNPED
jgi:hypothetical protein